MKNDLDEFGTATELHDDNPPIVVWCDGACKSNPGLGSYGTVMLWKQHRHEFARAFRLTTNNRMEILGMLDALLLLKNPSIVHVYTDSRYVHDTITYRYWDKWIERGWRTAGGTLVKNKDLWLSMLPQIEKHSIKMFWVKGHSGVEMNEYVDRLANAAIAKGEFEVDVGYEALAPAVEMTPTRASPKPYFKPKKPKKPKQPKYYW